jgi:ferredoxin, 2Fe-2S
MIQVELFYNQEIHEVTTYNNEYRNLMQLIADRLVLDDFGECKGEGKCGTCMVATEVDFFSNNKRQGNENNTISKFKNSNENLRLSCQILCNDKINQQKFRIVEAI